MVKFTPRLLIGLTGGIASGKTSVSNLFAAKGVPIIDADVLARQALALGSPLLNQVFDHFGTNLQLEDGSLDRQQLRVIVFNNSQAKEWLEQLVHPWVEQQILEQLQTTSGPYTLLSSPLLLESGQQKLVDRVLVVDIPTELQIARGSSRDANSPELIQKIMAQQISRSARLAQADDLIDNSGDLTALQQQVDVWHQRYLNLAAQLKLNGLK